MLGAWLDPGLAFAGGYITVLKIQMEVYKDGRREKIGSI